MRRLSINPVASTGESAAQRFSIALLELTRDDEADEGQDLGLALVELLAYLDDVLSDMQDRVANEAYLDADLQRDADLLRIRMVADVRPMCCIVADAQRTFLVAVGPEAEEATVHFRDGLAGAPPPTGSDDIAAIYRGGAGEVGNLELRGMGLREPLAVIVIGHPVTGTGCLHVWRSRAGSAS